MNTTTRTLAVLGAAFAVTAVLIAGGLCCAETADACHRDGGHSPATTISSALSQVARVHADPPVMVPFACKIASFALVGDLYPGPVPCAIATPPPLRI